MKLYDFPFSSNCRKVRAVAYELGVPLDLGIRCAECLLPG
jgi:glutathione S-transferase